MDCTKYFDNIFIEINQSHFVGSAHFVDFGISYYPNLKIMLVLEKHFENLQNYLSFRNKFSIISRCFFPKVWHCSNFVIQAAKKVYI